MMNRPGSTGTVLQEELTVLPVAELFLGVDGLKDAYTHCGKTISESPHAELITRIIKGNTLGKSEYVRLERIGALDGRDTFWRPVSYHEKITRSRIEEARNPSATEEKPISVYEVGGKYYIADGKHRAALYSLLGRATVNCRVRPLGAATLDYMRQIAEIMKQKPEKYTINLALISAILNEKKERES